MSTEILLTVVMPTIIAVIMFGIGLTLKLEDFKRVLSEPRAIGIGILCQVFLLPILAYFLVITLKLSPPYAIGFMILAASPGGPTANLFSHLAGGAVAINVTLTAVSSVILIVAIPLVAEWSLMHFLDQGRDVQVNSAKLIQTTFFVVAPMAIAMWISSSFPKFRDKVLKPIQISSVVLVVLMIIGSILKERQNIAEAAKVVGIAALLFNIVSVLTGYFIPRFFKMSERMSAAVAFEVGLHNSAIAMALSVNPVIVEAVRASGNEISDFSVAFPGAAYSVIMYISGGVLLWIFKRRLIAAP